MDKKISKSNKHQYSQLKKLSKKLMDNEIINIDKRLPIKLIGEIFIFNFHNYGEMNDLIPMANKFFKIDKRSINPDNVSVLEEEFIKNIRDRIKSNKEAFKYLIEYNNYVRLRYKLKLIKNSKDLDEHYKEISDYLVNNIISKVQMNKIKRAYK